MSIHCNYVILTMLIINNYLVLIRHLLRKLLIFAAYSFIFNTNYI